MFASVQMAFSLAQVVFPRLRIGDSGHTAKQRSSNESRPRGSMPFSGGATLRRHSLEWSDRAALHFMVLLPIFRDSFMAVILSLDTTVAIRGMIELSFTTELKTFVPNSLSEKRPFSMS